MIIPPTEPDCHVGSGPSPKATQYTQCTQLTQYSQKEDEDDTHNSDPSVLTGHTVLLECSAEIGNAIERTLPAEPGQYSRKIFDLARELRGIRALRGLDANDLESEVAKWYRLAAEIIEKDDLTTVFVDFRAAWNRVKHPVGDGPLDNIFADSQRAGPPVGCERFADGVRALAAFCRELQRRAGDNPFFLAGREAARLLNIHHVTAAKWLKHLENHKIIAVVTKGGRSRASEYRYIGELEMQPDEESPW